MTTTQADDILAPAQRALLLGASVTRLANGHDAMQCPIAGCQVTVTYQRRGLTNGPVVRGILHRLLFKHWREAHK